KGTEEIFFAVLATTVALAAVFLPVIFLTGTTGRLFREFGIVVAGSVIISSFVALTMTSMLSSRLLKKREKHSWFYEKTEPFYLWLNEKYNNALAAFMKVRWVSFLIIGGMAVGIYFLFTSIPTELAPIEDRGEIRINVTGPEGATYEYMERVMDELDRELAEAIPESERVGLISMTSPSYGSASTNTGNIRLILTDATERTRSQQEIFEQVSGILRNKTSVRAFASQAQSIGDRR